eukprot:261334-Chlamydomonas_euryale.AAC.1
MSRAACPTDVYAATVAVAAAAAIVRARLVGVAVWSSLGRSTILTCRMACSPGVCGMRRRRHQR